MHLTEKNALKYLYLLALIIGSGIRLFLVLTSNGMLHPDEIFQTIEPGHYLHYGYGIRAYEFSETGSYLDHYNISRSWIVPLVFAAYFALIDLLPISYIVGLYLLKSLTIVHTLLTIHAFKLLLDKIYSDYRYGYITGIFLAFSNRYILLSTRFFYNLFMLPLVFIACAYAYEYLGSDDQLSEKQQIVVLLGIGLATYVRVDLLIFVIPLLLMRPAKWVQKMSIVYLAVAGWLLGSTIDYFFFKSISISSLLSVPYNWFIFNVIKGYSSIFGVQSFGWYFQQLVIGDGLWPFFLLFVLLQISNHAYFQSRALLFGNLLIGWLIYENPFTNGVMFWLSESHKEIRFIITHYFLLLAVISIFIVDSYDALLGLQLYQHRIKITIPRLRSVILSILLIYMISVPSALMLHNGTSEQLYSDSLNTALLQVSEATDPTAYGVLVCNEWYYTGGYTYLHHNIPFVFLLNKSSNATALFTTYLLAAGFNYLLMPKLMYGIMPANFTQILNQNWMLTSIVMNTTEVWIAS